MLGVDVQHHFFTTRELDAKHVITATENAVAHANNNQQPGCSERWFCQLHEIEFHRRRDQVKHWQLFHDIPADEEIKNQAGDHQRGEQARGHANREGDAEAFHGTRAHENQNDGGNERGDVRIENRSEGAVVTGLHRAA